MNPKHIARAGKKLWFLSMGKRFRITAIFTNTDEANAYMNRHDRQAVIACFGPFILLADKYDDGGRVSVTEAR